jgi:hypothetical protein
MIDTDIHADIAKLEAAEDKLEQALAELDRCSVFQIAPHARPKRIAAIAAELEAVLDDLKEALDCLQLGLGRPYVWLLNR